MMIQAKTRMLKPVLASALLGAFAAGCSVSGNDDADKAGGSDAPVVLRLAVADDADQPDAPFARYFARRVSALSDGSVRVRVVWDAAGQDSPGYELGIARLVRNGDFELGWMGARAWDRMGIKSFQALQAPFLVTDHELLGRITTGPLATRMLRGLDGHGFVGLAVVPEHMRYAFGAKKTAGIPRRLRRGTRPREALGRHGRHHARTGRHTRAHQRRRRRRCRGEGGDRRLRGVAWDQLGGRGRAPSHRQRPALPQDAHAVRGRRCLRPAGRGPAQGDPRGGAAHRSVCGRARSLREGPGARLLPRESAVQRGRGESRGDVAALEDAAQPVYTQMERDPDTRATIAAIRALKAASPAAPAAAPPVTCEIEKVTVSGRERSPSAVNGTYHWRVTEEGGRAAAEAVGGTPDGQDLSVVGKMTLRDGRWLLGEDYSEEDSGTYRIVGDKLVFDWGVSTLTFEFARDGDGTIRLTPLPPMNAGDAVVWGGAPWQRVGPPVRDIP